MSAVFRFYIGQDRQRGNGNVDERHRWLAIQIRRVRDFPQKTLLVLRSSSSTPIDKEKRSSKFGISGWFTGKPSFPDLTKYRRTTFTSQIEGNEEQYGTWQRGRQIDFEMVEETRDRRKDRVTNTRTEERVVEQDNERDSRREPRKYMVPTDWRGTRHLTIIQITFGSIWNRLESRLTLPSILFRFPISSSSSLERSSRTCCSCSAELENPAISIIYQASY